jgi:hypothetical protein
LLSSQIILPGAESYIERFGVAGVTIILIVFLWREDRKGRIEQQNASNQRYVDLVNKLTEVIQSSTAAATRSADETAGMREDLRGAIISCPYASKDNPRRAHADVR